MDLYNKYRPRKFEDLYPTTKGIAQFPARIAAFLGGDLTALPQNMIFHSEMPGLGKTTCGRILADMLNPNLSDEEREAIHTGGPNPVFFEINGGDYRKIDDARTLAEQVKYRSSNMWGYRYVYMINEAHQLTSDAQQLLLDTTENLPNHIFMIFTTTDIHALNDKLRSRLEKHQFQPLAKPQLAALLTDIAKAEGKTLPQEHIDEIYVNDNGCPRGSIVSLGKYLRTGYLEMDPKPGAPDEHPYFKEYIDMMERVALGDKSVKWNDTIKPRIQTMLDAFNTEEMRIKIVQRLGSVLMGPTCMKGKDAAEVMRKAKLYQTLAEVFDGIIRPPQRSDMIVRCFKAYMTALEIAASGEGGTK